MSFFYDLNKRLADLAKKQEQQVVAESKKVEAVAKSPLTQALNEGDYSAKKAAAGKDIGKPGKAFSKIAKSAAERYGSKEAGERVAGAVLNKLRHPKESVEQHDSQQPKLVRDLKAQGLTDKQIMQKMKELKHGTTKSVKESTCNECGMYESKCKCPGVEEGNAFTGALAKTPKGEKFKVGNKEFTDTSSIEEADVTGLGEEEMDEGYAEMDAWLKSREKEKGTGRFDKKKISTGTVYTRKPETFDDPETDPEATGGAPKRRGRPKGKDKGPERTTAKAWKHKGARVEEGDEHVCEMCGQPVVAEKAPPGAKAERMVKHIKKSLSKDGKLSDKDKAIAYATTWKAHNAGKVEEEGSKPDFLDVDKDGDKKETFKKAVKDKSAKKEVDETTTSGSVATATAAPKASKGMQFGKGVYESLDSKLENMIAEGMNVTVNMNSDAEGDAQKSITVTATGTDADKLAELLKMAGLEHKKEVCPGCGEADCGCEEELDENSPDYPTNTETLDADPELRTYSGGLNGPKSTGQTTIPVIASQLRRQVSMEENVELERSLFKTWKNYKG